MRTGQAKLTLTNSSTGKLAPALLCAALLYSTLRVTLRRRANLHLCAVGTCDCAIVRLAGCRWSKALNAKDDGKSAIKINTKGAESEGYEVVPFGK